MEEKTYTKKELNRLLAVAFHYGVDAGEKGIPEDFPTEIGLDKLEWYSKLVGPTIKEIFEHEKSLLR